MKMMIVMYLCLSVFVTIKSVDCMPIRDQQNDNDGVSRLIHNERRLIDPVTISAISALVGTISAIAGTTSAAINAAKVVSIDDDGAQFQIDNYFKDIQLHYKGKYISEGEQMEKPSSLIMEATTNSDGGAFNDDGPDAFSAGYVQYEITNPISLDKYCMCYQWASDTEIGNYLPSGNWIIGAIRHRACPSPYDGFVDMGHAADYSLSVSMERIIDGTCDILNNGFEDCLDLDQNWYSSDSVYNFQSVETAQSGPMRLSSIDTKIAMELVVSTPDGDEDHPSIKIIIGPYKKVYGKALSGDYDLFFERPACLPALPGTFYMGQFSSATECHDACRRKPGWDCKYFQFSGKTGQCILVADVSYCTEQKDAFKFMLYHKMNLYNNINYASEYMLLENSIHCEGDRKQIGSNQIFSTTDECWNKCKQEFGDQCEFFTFGYVGTDYGKCYLESQCAEGRYINDNAYNLYGKLKSE